VRDPAELWKLRVHSLDRSRKAARRGETEGLHDLRVALRRIGVTARALGARPAARTSKKLAQSLSADRQLQVDRQLLSRLAKLGYLSPDTSTALAGRWEKLSERSNRRITRVTSGRKLRGLKKDLERLSRRNPPKNAVERLESARRKAEVVLTQPLEGKDDEALHRYRLAVKKARYIAEDLFVLGLRRFAQQVEREKRLQEALGRWNDLRLFRRRLAESRDDAEMRGAVSLAAELERLLAVLEPTIATVRRTAVEASRESAEVVPLKRTRRANG
jgi:CHAD domain-containing protein